jgi:hypothetical protein
VTEKAVDPARYATAEDDLLNLILQESDKRVGAQIQLMLGADQRANGLLAGCATLAAAGGGFAISQLKSATFDPLFYSSLAFGGIEACASMLALMALWPEPLKPQGWAPAQFAHDLAKPSKRIKAEMAMFMQGRIEDNRRCATRLSYRIKGAMLLAAQGPIIALSVGFFASGKHSLIAFATALFAIWFIVTLGIPLIPGSFERMAKDR